VAYPPRQIGGFYKRDELELLIQRRTGRKNLAETRINTAIAGHKRPYQQRAIRAITKSFEQDGERKALWSWHYVGCVDCIDGQAPQRSGVRLQSRFPLGPVFRVSETRSQSLADLVSHGTKRRNAPVPLCSFDRVDAFCEHEASVTGAYARFRQWNVARAA
jgi:hypothetical protein